MGKSKKKQKSTKNLSSSDEEEWVEKESLDNKSQKRHSKTKNKYRDSSTSSSDSERRRKRSKKKHRRKREYSSSSTSSSASDSDNSKKYFRNTKQRSRSRSPKCTPETISKHTPSEKTSEREEWMSMQTKLLTSSNSDRKRERDEQKRLEREKQQYDPRNCDRELNPYWKHGGDGLPKFKKPDDSDSEKEKQRYKSSNKYSRQSNWRKKKEHVSSERTNNDSTFIKKEDAHEYSRESNWKKKKEIVSLERTNNDNTLTKKEDEEEVQITEKDLNALAAKLVKAEIMGNTKLVTELKLKLEKARNSVKSSSKDPEDIILTQTDSRGQSKPVRLQSEYGESSKGKRKKTKIETHSNNERVRYFADDDKYSLKQMFENEKYNSAADQDKEFIKTFSKIRKNDDLDDIFSDNIRQKESDSKVDERNRSKAINDHQHVSKSLDNCSRCLQSEYMLKHLMVSMGDTVYLALPPFEPLTEGHCMIVPLRHTPCTTQLDENEWSDVLNVRKSLVKMFKSENMCVVFFECAMRLQRFPHMVIECIPMPIEEGDMAPIYFKKAIDESEIEWAQNKKLVSLKGRDVRKAIPKGLSYFSVSFDMEEGFAHVIEDEELFPANFAQEIIGGMLDLHHSKWRKPKKQSFEEQSKRVMEFSAKWKSFDCLVNY